MPQEANDQERRRFQRITINFVTVEVITPQGQPETPEFCFVINLSENGLMFRSERDYRSGQMLMLTFTIPDGQETMIRTKAIVIHRQELDSSKFIGVQFKELGIAEHRLLRNYISGFLKSQQQPPST
jgi:Tfp pilus assembly protein PilZ